MAFTIPDGGTSRTITRAYVRQDGVTRAVKRIQVMDGGALRTVATFADAMSVTVGGAVGNAYGSGPANVTTNNTTAVVTGGFSPYTYAWSLVSNGGGTASTATNPTSATTAFQKVNVPQDASYTDVWQVTVTDAVGSTATAATSAQFSNFNFDGRS